MRRYYEAILLKLIEFWKNQIWLLHHDNAPDHAFMLMRELPPDLAPADIFLVPKLKTPIKGKRFATIEEIK